MELPKRKPLRLKEFSYSNGGSYFLTLCMPERKKILSKIEPLFGCKFIDELPRDVFPFDGDDRYLRVIPTDIGKITEKYILSSEKIKGVSIDDYVIMPDHVHIIVSITDETVLNKGTENEKIPKIVSALKRLIQKEVGGPIFQRSYYDHVIRNHEDYENILTYIHKNPARWYFRQLNGEME